MKDVVGETHRVPESCCTNCGKKLDACSQVDAEGEFGAPHPGAACVCITCGHIMVFDDELKLRELTDEEVVDLAGNKEILAIQWARGQMIKRGISLKGDEDEGAAPVPDRGSSGDT